MKISPTALVTALEFVGQVAGTAFDRQALEKKNASPETKSNLEQTATVLEKKAAEPEKAESNDQAIEVRDGPKYVVVSATMSSHLRSRNCTNLLSDDPLGIALNPDC